MKYFIDCEFDGYQGQLLSMALVSETGKSMYVTMQCPVIQDKWVNTYVIPVILAVPMDVIDGPLMFCAGPELLSKAIEDFLRPDADPHIIADWPDDIKYFMDALITGPGTMINVQQMKCSVKRVDAYPTDLPGAIQHNAWWDAMALRHLMLKGYNYDR